MRRFDDNLDRDYSEFTEALAALRSFDLKAFVGDERLSQDVCDLILSLAVAYNDLKDSIYAYLLIEKERPSAQPKVTRRWGNYGGIREHVLRSQMSILHELIFVLRDNKGTLSDKGFKALVRQLTVPSREAMESLIKVAEGRPAADPVGKVLLMVRNKVGSHYDPKMIAKGFTDAFASADAKIPPIVSAGPNMLESRFYYADAAAQHCVKLAMADAGVTEKELAKVVDDVNQAILQLIGRFLSYRGFGLRDVQEEDG